MKRRFLKSTLVVAAVALAGMGVVKTYEKIVVKQGAGGLLAQNVEALSDGEQGSADMWICYSSTKKGAGCWICGPSCWWDPARQGSGSTSTCHK